MGFFRDFILGQPLEKKEGATKEKKPTESNSSTDKNKISGDISIEAFVRIVTGKDPDPFGHYNFDGYGGDKEKMQKRFGEVIKEIKEGGRHINKGYIHEIAKRLENEPSQASKLLARKMEQK